MAASRKIFAGESRVRQPMSPHLEAPARMAILGSSGSGKTAMLLKDILLRRTSPWRVPHGRILWCAPRPSLQQAKLVAAKKCLGDSLQFIEGLDRECIEGAIEAGLAANPDLQQLLVLDDLVGDSSRDPYISQIFMTGRHRNVSICEVGQRVYAGPESRTHRLNSTHLILFPFAAPSEITRLLQDLSPDGWRQVYDAYKDAVRGREWGYFVVDLASGQSPDPERRKLKYRCGWEECYPALSEV